MTRRRRAPLALSVCIGIFLLLFSTVAADPIKEPSSSIAGKVLASNESDTSTSERNETIPNKIPTTNEAEGNEGPVDSYNATKRDLETVHGRLIKAEGEEKVAASIDKVSEADGIRSRNEVDRSSTLDSTNGGSRFDEILYGTSGKSSSTKTVAEDVHRLSRTNDLTTATAKPGLEDSRLEEKVNETVDASHGTNRTVKTLEDVLQSREELESSASRPEGTNSTIEKSILPEEFPSRIKKAENQRPTKNSEVSDLEKAENDGSVSLINDTNVNYSHRYRTSTEESHVRGTSIENGNSTLEDSSTRESGDPKEEVEVVGNVTDAVTQRVMEHQSPNSTSKHEKRKDLEKSTSIEENERQKSLEVTLETSSPVPRGRTIAFSGINEFPAASSKPYPYARSSSKEETEDATTEEASALENTIGRGQSEEKFIVTEASDVLENSIQQFKPAYYEKPANESSTVSMTTLEEAVPTNQSVVDVANAPKTVLETVEKSTSTGNDVPRWTEGSETIDGKGNFDVTGNGITEVSSKPETADKRANSTTRPQTDVQTNAESSMLIRETLNATEQSTEYPLIRANASSSDATTLRSPETVTVLSTVEDVSNGTNEIPSGVAGTFSPDKPSAFVPTTTSIEYEFVGLSETTAFLSQNVTEETPILGTSNTTVPTVQDLRNSSEASTVGETTVETEAPNVDDRFSSVTDQTTLSREEFTTQSVFEEQSESTTTEDVQKTSVTDSWTTVTEEDVTTESSEQPDSKDSRLMLNVTESTMKTTVIMNDSTTDAARTTTSNPFATGSLQPRVPVSITMSTPITSDATLETTADTKMSSEEITSLVRIVMNGSWYDVCSKIDQLRLTLVELLTIGMNQSISDKQIIFHQDRCSESPSSTPTPADMLPSILVYVVDKNGKFDSAMTNSLPGLYEELQNRVQFPISETIPDSGNAIAVIVVSSVAFICLILLAGLLFIMRKRQTRFNYGERCRPVSLDAYSVDSVSAYNSVRRKGVARSSKRSYGNPTFEDSSAIPSHPLNFAGLSSFCNDTNAINEEFSGIPQVSAKIDELPLGAEVKNRYANVIPLPETRVPLQKMNNNPLTEYINASYVRGPKNAMRYYIACQAPMESTITDFWRMIWEQQCKVIIMLTDLVENGVEKCTEYIPPSEITDCHRLYGDFQVTLKKRETKEKYAISTLHLKNLENNTFREVYHIWYLWPVNGAQSDGAGLIAVLLEARALQRGGPGPIVVHCSPGTGRTGTLIALDLGIRQYEITRTVDVPRVVYTIRRDRAGAVQTKEQYAFIYKALNLYATKLAGGVLDST
ncbi:uncharacterized protein LOC122404971 isoform X2 [Colletes gigas]|uniref:uncharacterized protein LOC122404971 isoform X2 n=1 Tax=Colletes gigas TaxID=935657 RepID=UPI001C9B9920|nr:uncharacterized protein LOC122404971 isoform X2 [Colletes gigas]